VVCGGAAPGRDMACRACGGSSSQQGSLNDQFNKKKNQVVRQKQTPYRQLELQARKTSGILMAILSNC